MSREFKATQAKLQQVPLLIGLMGPPGGGKTKSALRLADGMKRVRGGPVVLIDTERGRSLKYAKGAQNPNGHDFMHVDFQPPFKPEDFLDAVQQQLRHNPSAVIIDSASDEHEGEGGVLDWHDQQVPAMGGNEYAAWAKPKASRRKMLAGFQQIDTPLIFCFRAREKTEQQKINNRNTPVKIGLQPVAPMEFIHTLDLTCLLPARADGVPVWNSPKGAEDFVIKYPEFLRPHIREGQLSEATGEALARWAMGEAAPPMDVTAWEVRCLAKIKESVDARDLAAWWNSAEMMSERKTAHATDAAAAGRVKAAFTERADALTGGV